MAEKLAALAQSGVLPALVTPAHRRRFLRTVLMAKGLAAPVLSYEEIGLEARPALVGTIPA
jgi:flagellar biosynthesis protein FlhA